MLLSKLKTMGAVLIVAAGVVSAGAFVRAYQLPPQSESAHEEQPDPIPPPAGAGERPDEVKVESSQHEPAKEATKKFGRRMQNSPQDPSPAPGHGRSALIGGGGHGGVVADSGTWMRVRMEAGIRQEIAVLSRRLQDQTPTGKVILSKLEEPIEMSFANETPLEDVLKYIRAATAKGETDRGIPIYVDPEGLALAEKTMQSPISIDLQGIPLRVTLQLALRQIGLAYCVKDGVLIISCPRIIVEELNEMKALLEDGVE